MKLEEAVKILRCLDHTGGLLVFPELIEASKLGIEALKDLQRFDEIRGRDARLLLPGETKD